MSSHRYSLKIIESPACTCDFVNEEFHFIFVLQLYNRPRVALQNAISHIASLALKTLLYGADDANKNKNTEVIKKTEIFYRLKTV